MSPFARLTSRDARSALYAVLLVMAGGCGPQSHERTSSTVGSRVTVTPSNSSIGEAAEYGYDAAGNVLQIRSAGSTTVSVTGFQPARGGVGQTVTVSGAGFSPMPSLNRVTLGGLAVAVLSATSSQLTFAVPAGATTGKISVTSGTTTGTSSSDFTVVTGVEVSDFSPKLGTSATVVTIIGQNFDPNRQADSVSIGGGAVSVTAASYTSLMTMVGNAATSGKITVTTGSSSGTSAADFFLVPSGYLPGDVEFTGRAIAGEDTPVSVSNAGKVSLVLFDGRQGEHLSLYVSSVTFAGSTKITLYSPAGTSVFSATVSSSQAYKLVPPALPSSGTYTAAIEPAATSTGGLHLQVFEDAAAEVTVGGDASLMALANGQNGRYTFSGTAGDLVAFAITSLTTTPSGSSVAFTFYKPDGTQLYPYTFSSPGSVSQLPWALPTSGTYTLTVVPTGTAAASATVMLSLPITGALATDGSTTRYENTRPGQPGRYTFTGTAGQRFTMQVTAGATFTGSINVYQPSGASIASAYLNPNSNVKVDLGALPATGTYTAAVSPSGVALGTVDLRVIAEDTGILAIGDPAKTVTLGTAQNGRYTFSGTAGDLVAFAITSLTTTPSGSSVAFIFYKPDGTQLYPYTFSSPGSVSQLPWALPTSGTYTLAVVPAGTAAASATVMLSLPITGALATDGSTTRYENTRPGQPGRYTFTGTAGQRFTMQVTAGSTFTGSINVYQPSGASIASANLNPNSNVKIDLGALPTTGTYTAAVSPSGISLGTVDLRLVAVSTGTLVVGDPATTITLGTAQNGRYTFTGNAGDLLGLGLTSIATTPSGGTVAFSIYKPDGSSMWSTSAAAATSWQLPQLPTTSAYTLSIILPGTAAASLTVQVTKN